MRFLTIFLLAGALAGCSDASGDLSTQFSTTPFRHLRGVELGMKGSRLHQIRPAARYAPYLGLQERITGYTVSYQFPTTTTESAATDVGPNETLEGIFITETFVSREAAEKSWRDQVRELTSARRAPNACESFPSGGLQARWFSGKNVLAIGVFPREPMAPNVGDRVIYALAPKTTMKQPAGPATIACPTS
jgi:hypothetical protein